MVKISAIIVLFNEFEAVKFCLASLYGERIPDMEVILVDNSTNKEGHKEILEEFPDIIYIQNKKDVGFGRAVNIGTRRAAGEFVAVLTPDMYLIPGTTQKSFKYMQQNPQVGVLSCKIYSSPKVQEPSAVVHYPGILSQLYYFNMPFYKLVNRFIKGFHPIYASMNDHKKVLSVKAVGGQYMFMRRSAVLEVNGFDPRIFLYFEDYDLCKRLITKNWKIVYLPVGGVVQRTIGEWKKNVRITQTLPWYMESVYFFLKKHKGRLYTTLAFLVGILSAILSVPYLFIVSKVKSMFGLSSQASALLPLWIKITKWHLDNVKVMYKTL